MRLGVVHRHAVLEQCPLPPRLQFVGDLPCEFRVGQAERLEFEDESFDACRAERVLQHVTDPARAVAQMRRDMESLLERLTGGTQTDGSIAGVFPPMNVSEDRDHYYVRALVPGIEVTYSEALSA